MLASHLHRADEPRPEQRAPLPVRHTGESGNGRFDYYKDADDRGIGNQFAKALDLLFRRKWIVLTSFLVVLAGTGVYTMTRVPQYQAYSFVMVDLGNTKVSLDKQASLGDDPSGADYNLFAWNDRSISSELLLLRISDQLERRVHRRLQGGYSENADSTRQSDADTVMGRPGSAMASSSLIDGYARFTQERESDNIIRITGISSEAKQAARFANLYAEEYVRLTQEASRTYLSALRTSLEDKEQIQRKALSRLEEQVMQYTLREGAIDPDRGTTHLIGQIEALEVQRDEAHSELQAKQATLTSLEQEFNEMNPRLAQRIASSVDLQIKTAQEKRAELEASREQILLQNPEWRGREADNETLRQINQQIQQLDTALDSLSRKYVDEVMAAGSLAGEQDGVAVVASRRQKMAEYQITISELQTRIEVMDNRLREYRRRLQSLPSQAMDLARLERSRQHAEEMYGHLIEQLQETRIKEESDPGYAQLIRRARPLRRPFYPNSRRNLILGVLFGFLLSFALAVTYDKLDNHIYQQEQLRSLGFKEAGIIPNVRLLIEEDHHGKDYVEQEGQVWATSLVVLFNPMSTAAEAYRHLRTNIEFMLPDTPVHTLLVTSPSPTEGKSTTAANLAIVMAQSGSRTLLIDADLRRPRLHRMFGLHRESGLVQLLLNGSHIDSDAWETSIDNLSVLTANKSNGSTSGESGFVTTGWGSDGVVPRIANTADLLGSQRMQEVLEAMRERFDIVIIDTSPLLAATDATVLSTQCDATLVVARAGKTRERDLDYAMEMLVNVGSNVLGVLLNAFDLSMAYGSRYRYQHYTKYGRYSKYGYYGSYGDK